MRFQRMMCSSLILSAALFQLLAPAAVCGGTISFNVAIDTSSFSGTAGDIEFQLGGSANNVPITASFTNFASDATLNGPTQAYPDLGYLIPLNPPHTDFSGTLNANTLSLYNDDSAFQITDVDQLISSFGTYLNFQVTFTGNGVGSASSSNPSLAISLFDASGQPLFSGPALTNYAAAFYQVNTDGTVTPSTYSPVSSVPEPSTVASFAIGLLSVILVAKRRAAISTSPATSQ